MLAGNFLFSNRFVATSIPSSLLRVRDVVNTTVAMTPAQKTAAASGRLKCLRNFIPFIKKTRGEFSGENSPRRG
jgi:hypothetical protein